MSLFDFLLFTSYILLDIHNIKCFDNSDVAYANLNLTILNSNENLYFGKGGVYHNKINLQPVNGILTYLVEHNSSNSCKNNIGQSLNIALIDLKDDDLDTHIRSVSCYAAGILITNTDSNSLRLNTNLNGNDFTILMVSNSTGKKILDHMNKSMNDISITITAQDSTQFRELSATSLAFIIIGSFVIVFIVSSMWALFYKIQKHRRIEDRELLAIIMRKLTKKAISKMNSKKLKDGDEELVSGEICTICLDDYKINDPIRTLPCSHYFHKTEIDTWLFENQTCPICKIDILKAYDLEIKTSSGFFRRQLERLNLIQSPMELSEAIISYADSRRGTLVNSRRSTIYSTTGPSILNDSVYHTRRNSLFFGERFSDFGILGDQMDDDSKPRTTRRLTFFGDNLDDLENQQTETEYTNEDDDSNRSKLQLIVQDLECNPTLVTKISAPSLPTILSNEIFRTELKTLENVNTDDMNKRPTFIEEKDSRNNSADKIIHVKTGDETI